MIVARSKICTPIFIMSMQNVLFVLNAIWRYFDILGQIRQDNKQRT